MLPIQKKFIKYNYGIRSVNDKIIYIVIHDTANPNATALNHFNYFNGGNRNASADFFVDTNNIIQTVDYAKNYSWHCGDGNGKYGITNRNSIGIEMCLVEPYDKVMKNTVELVVYLMKELNIPLDRVVRHYDASRKNCPASLSGNNWAKWYEFKNKIVEQIIKEEFSMNYKDQHLMSEWAKSHIERVTSFGIMKGDENLNFNPKQTLTREEAAVIASNIVKYITGK
jgi:N-acetylmuramoyl-L-alanine amidase